MQITCEKGDILKICADLVCVGIYKNEDWDNDFLLELNELLDGSLKKDAKAANFEGNVGQTLLYPAPAGMEAKFLLVVGLGELKESLEKNIRAVSGLVYQTARQTNARTIAVEFFGEDHPQFQAKDAAQAITEALQLKAYSFDSYKEEKKAIKPQSVTIVAEDGRDARKAQKGIAQSLIVADGVNVARDLVNTPAKDMNPTRLAQAAEKIASMSDGRIKIKVYDRAQCEKKNMGAYLAVAQGSDAPPKFIHLTYKPEGRVKKSIALVGKGVTFDSGGLSLKPGAYMESMKCDMGGAAAVLGVFATLARLQPAVEVHGIIAATENMPSGKAIRPGDVVRAMNGKTIEILNTDAEGRLTLADALGYAAKQHPDVIVDLATLTGACVVGLGEEIAGLMTDDDELAEEILGAAKQSDEELWRMPLYSGYRKLMNSDIADIRNISTSRYGGSLTAGLFLKDFVEPDQSWAHMDIAGPAFAERPIGTYLAKGGTGYGVRTLTTWLQSI